MENMMKTYAIKTDQLIELPIKFKDMDSCLEWIKGQLKPVYRNAFRKVDDGYYIDSAFTRVMEFSE